MVDQKRAFPPDFYWGASTAAHQVEGGLQNNWTRWEKKHATDLARNAYDHLLSQKRYFAGFPDWSAIAEKAQSPDNYISGTASDHYNRFEEDFELAAELNHTAHRFSLAWSRIQPEKGVTDDDALQHYHRVITALCERGIEPFITLWHFTLPQWVADEGGWTNPDVLQYFDQYVKTVVEEFKDDVTYWITINEPQVHAANTYLGSRPTTASRGILSYLRAIRNMIAAHKQAYTTIHRIDETAKVGLSTNNGDHIPYHNKLQNRLLVRFVDWWWNDYVLNHTHTHLDFIGLNHYNRNVLHHGRNVGSPPHTSDLGWGLYPDSIYNVLTNLKKYNTPIIITENGVADADDRYREDYLVGTLLHVHKAIKEGVPVNGYLHWSLLDNFEWELGFWPRFGLIEVDHDTYERTVRRSAERYAEIIAQNAVPDQQ